MPSAHHLTHINPEDRTGVCATCGLVRIHSAGTRWHCAVNARQRPRGRRTDPRSRHHGLRKSERRALIEGATCAICGSTYQLRVDHDHTTGQIRGVLCQACNVGLGWFRDDPERLVVAVAYLRTAARV